MIKQTLAYLSVSHFENCRNDCLFEKTFHYSIPLFMLSSLTLDHQITTKADSAFTSITPSDFSNCSSSVN